jgi:hypothetical protein
VRSFIVSTPIVEKLAGSELHARLLSARGPLPTRPTAPSRSKGGVSTGASASKQAGGGGGVLMIDYLESRPWEAAAERQHESSAAALKASLAGRVATLADGLGLGEGTLDAAAVERAKKILASRHYGGGQVPA